MSYLSYCVGLYNLHASSVNILTVLSLLHLCADLTCSYVFTRYVMSLQSSLSQPQMLVVSDVDGKTVLQFSPLLIHVP